MYRGHGLKLLYSSLGPFSCSADDLFAAAAEKKKEKIGVSEWAALKENNKTNSEAGAYV